VKQNIPWFDCSDKELEEIYYFRWWTFRKHLKLTPAGYIITEFLPAVPWGGKFNSIIMGKGFRIFLNGRQIVQQPGLTAVSVAVPQ
jgi:hypothetical protein